MPCIRHKGVFLLSKLYIMQFTTRVLSKLSHSFIRKLLMFFIFVFVGSNVFAQPTNSITGDVAMPSPTAASLGKYTDIPVSHFTGVPSISIPIHTIQEGSVSLPISISYHASGTKVGEPASRVGMGWSLNAGGMISRTILGLPDEREFGYLNVGADLDGCNNGTELASVGTGDLDSEPDIFSYNFAGYSGKFFFTDDESYHHVNRSDIKVEMDIVNYKIESFILTTPDGNRYHFGKYGAVTAFERTESLDRTGWYLLRVENHALNQYIELEYEDENYSYEFLGSCQKVELIILDSGCSGSSGETCSSSISNNGKMISRILSKRLKAIRSFKEDIVFDNGIYRTDLDAYSGLGGTRLEKIEITSGDVICKKFHFDYSYFTDPSDALSSGKRLKLDGIREESCTDGSVSPLIHTFHYNGDFLPSRLSKATDHWGYYNGAITNNSLTINCPPSDVLLTTGAKKSFGAANRNTKETPMKVGILEQIDYPTGGHALFEYEANRAYIDLNQAAINPSLNGNAVAQLFDKVNIIPSQNTCPAYFNDPASCCGTLTTTTTKVLSASDIAFGEVTMRYQRVDPYNATPPNGDCASKPGRYRLTMERIDIPSSTLAVDYTFTVGFDDTNLTTQIKYLRELGTIPPGEYEIKVITEHGRGTLDIVAPVQVPSVLVGGLRVKKVTLHDGNGTSNDIVKDYEYVNETDPTQSSGLLYSFPQYAIDVSSNCGGSAYMALFRATSITPLGNFEGFHIGYKRVVERTNGNGHITYNYYTEQRPMLGQFPSAPEPPTALNGKLSESRVYKEGETTPVQTTTNNRAGQLESTVPGLAYKLYKWPVNCFIVGVYNVTEYPLKTVFFHLESTEKELDGVRALTTYEYDNPEHTNMTATEIRNSDGELHRTEYTYAHEEGDTYMLDHNMVGIPITQKKIVGGVVGGTKTTFISGYPRISSEYLADGNETLLQRSEIGSYNSQGYPEDHTYMEYATEDYIWSNDGNLIGRSFLDWDRTYVYYDNTRILRNMTEIDGQVVHYEYDEFGRLKTTRARGNNVTTEYDYIIGNGQNKVITTTTFTDETPTQTVEQHYDGLGRLTKQVVNDITKKELKYDNVGRVAQETYLPGSFTTYEYEPSPLNRVEQTIFPDNNYTRTTYGSEGDYYKVTTYNERGFSTSNLTDILGRPHQMIDAYGSTTTNTYDERSNLKRIDVPGGDFYDYKYDIRNRLGYKKVPSSKPQRFYYEDDRDLLIYSIDGNGNRMDHEYDDYGRETKLYYASIPNWDPDAPINLGSIGSLVHENVYGENTASPINTGRIVETKTKLLGSQPASFIETDFTYDSYGRVNEQDESNPFGGDSYDFSYNLADWALEETRTHTKGSSLPLEIITKRGYDKFGRELFYNTRVDGTEGLLAVGRSYNEKDQVVGKYYAGLDPYSALDHVKYKYNIRGWLTDMNDVFYDLQEVGECGEFYDISGDHIQVEQEVLPDEFLDVLCQYGPETTVIGEDEDPCEEYPCFDYFYNYIANYRTAYCGHTGYGGIACTQLESIVYTDYGTNTSQEVPLNYPYLYGSSSSMAALKTDLENWLSSAGYAFDEVLIDVDLYTDATGRPRYYNVHIEVNGLKESELSFEFILDMNPTDPSYPIPSENDIKPFTKSLNRIMPCNREEKPQDVKSQPQSLLDVLAHVQSYTPANITYPVVAYQTHLEDNTTRWIPKDAMHLLTGTYRKGKRIHVSSAIEIFDVIYQNDSQANLSMPAFLQELGTNLGANLKDVATDSHEEECEGPIFDCTPEEQATQDESIAGIQNSICNLNASDFEYPLTINVVQLCDGSIIHIPGEELLSDLAGPYAVLNQFDITAEQFITILVTIDRPLFAMDFSRHQENGNIAELRWKVTDRSVKQYNYAYDWLDRMLSAEYGYYTVTSTLDGELRPDLVPSEEYSVPSVGYDAAGNIQEIRRNGMTEGANGCLEPNEIDKLSFQYESSTNPSRLIAVMDDAPLGPRSEGFKPGTSASIQYAYDNNGNLTQDAHKSLYNITYNFLNLPEQIGNMQVTYDATGKKWKKVGASGNTEYLNGIEYRNGILEAIYVGDGRLVALPGSRGPGVNFRAEYFHQDHLGNNRLTFCDFNNNGRIEISDDPGTPESELEITQETHYYPFGLEHKGNWYATVAPDNNYLYNGKELNRDFDINLYEYGARWYDPAIGRFTGVDPIADDFPHLSVYNYASNDPIKNIDLHGLQGVPNYMVEHVKDRIENAVQGTVDNISNAVQGAGNYIYDKIVGNDVIGNTVDGTELVTDNQKGEIVETVAKGAKVLGPVLDVAEGAKIINDNMTAETSEQKDAAGQDAAKFLLELGISVGVPAASIPANVLINTSRDGDVVTSPENIDRAAGAFESSISPAREMIENRIKQREEKNNDEDP